MSRPDAYEAAWKMLRENPQVTALFCVNDDTALGALNAARDMDLDVPEQLSIIGFDNIDLAKEVAPGLTTIHVPKAWMGILGVRHLIDRVQNPEQPKVTTIVSTQLVIRETTQTIHVEPIAA
jgi:DNA-binding LacI/PurR family transcriptional regulator